MMIDEILTLPITAQCIGFIGSLLLGAALETVFSLLKAVRLVFEPSVLRNAVEDVVYCLFCAAATFIYLMVFCYGRLRWYVFAGVFLGWWLFKLLIGDTISSLVSMLLKMILAVIKTAVGIMVLPLKMIYRLFAEKAYKNIKKVCYICKFSLKKYGKALYNFLYTAFYPKRVNRGKDVSTVAKRRRRNSSFFVRMVTFCFIVCAAVAFIRTQSDVVSKRRELAALEENIALQQASNDEIKRILDGGDNLEYIERIAREKLGYAYPDEKIFIDRSGN